MDKKGKRIKIRALLCIVFALIITACGRQIYLGDKEEDNSDLIVVGFSQPGAESAWRVALTDSVKENFTEERGYKLIYKDGRSKQDNQIKDIRTFIQQGVDYIIISPIVEDGWDTVLSEAKDAGIPVIICDRNVVVENESLYQAFVGSDFKAEGEYAISNLEKLLIESGNNDEVNIVHIQGTIGSSAQIGRTKALEEAVTTHRNWNIVAQDCGEFTKAKGREIMAQAIEDLGAENIDVVYCENDEEAYGAIQAMNEAGVIYGNKEGIKIVSFDAMNSALVLCMNGHISVEVECNPIQGPYIYNLISGLEKGNAVPKISYVHEECFTSENLSPEIIEKRRF
jgi:simple sugar transport system substrate-binding protein